MPKAYVSDQGGSNVVPIDAARISVAAGQGRKIRLRPGDVAGTWDIVGVTPETYMGPQQPIIPLAEQPYLGAQYRQYDYQVGYNLNYQPDALKSIWTMRALRINYDILGSVIDSRKDQLLALAWSIQPRDKKKKPDAACANIETILRMPDKSRDLMYTQWGNALLDDLFVGDCMTAAPIRTNAGAVLGFEYIDGATIFPLIDATGRRPLPPSPAYQQILKGIPAVDYTIEELTQAVRKPLTWRTFGFSPVEQIIITVNIALRRQAFQLDYYTQGSVPDAFGSLPATWTTAQIKELQDYWDSKFENVSGQNSAQRRHMKWIPDGKITFAKDQILKDQFDEWLARLICYVFGVDPTPFVAQVNRATAEQARESSLGDGLAPLKMYWADFISLLIAKYFGRPDLCFEFKEEDEQDPVQKAEMLDKKVRNGSLTLDEARTMDGLDPLPDGEGERAMVYTATGPVLLADVLNPPEPVAAPVALGPDGKPVAPGGLPAKGATGEKPPVKDEPKTPAEKLAKFAGERRNVMVQRQRLTRSVKRALKDQASTIAKQMATHLGKLAKSDEPPEGWETWFDWDAIFAPMADAVADPLTKTSADAVATGLDRLPQSVSSGIALGDFPNQYATDYARDRGAEMIGKRYDDAGDLVDNPDARWAITDETREAVRKTITQGVADGWTLDEFASNLASDYAFSPARADVIARTETRLADTRGQVAAWRESGVVQKKEWLLSEDEPCDDCVDNADAGAIDIDDTFPSGDDAPPLHPNCRCVVAPVVESLT